MTMGLEDYSRLIAEIYASTLDTARWDSTLAQVVNVMGGIGGALLITDPDARLFKHATLDLGHAAINSYNRYYGSMDPAAAMMDQTPAGCVMAAHHIISQQQRRLSEFFCDWAFLIGGGDAIFANILRNHNSVSWLCCYKPMDDDHFGTDERMDFLRLLLPHFQQALRMQCQFSQWGILGNMALDMLEQARQGIGLVSATGQLLYSNRSCQKLFACSDGITIYNNHLQAKQSNDNAQLQGLLALALRGDAHGVRVGGSMALRRGNHARPLVMHVLPLGQEDFPVASSPCGAMILIIDLQDQPPAPLEVLTRLYGLTRAEAAVAVRVLHCDGLQAIADDLAVSLSTVRIHLQRAFDKTGTHRQSELVRLLLKLQTRVDVAACDCSPA